MPPPSSRAPRNAPQSTRPLDLENSRLGVIYFLGNLRVDFSPEDSATALKNKALTILQGKVGDGKIMTVTRKGHGATSGRVLDETLVYLKQ